MAQPPRGAAQESFAGFEQMAKMVQQANQAINPTPNPLTVVLEQGMTALMTGATLLFGAAIHVINTSIYHLPRIGVSAALAIAANELAVRYQPNVAASMEAVLEGSFKVALLVGTTFFAKALIDPVVNLSIDSHVEPTKKNDREKLLYGTAVSYLCPLTITVIAARVYGLKVKTLEGGLYTLGLFGLIKVLEKGFTYGVEIPGVRWLVDKAYGRD